MVIRNRQIVEILIFESDKFFVLKKKKKKKKNFLLQIWLQQPFSNQYLNKWMLLNFTKVSTKYMTRTGKSSGFWMSWHGMNPLSPITPFTLQNYISIAHKIGLNRKPEVGRTMVFLQTLYRHWVSWPAQLIKKNKKNMSR